VSRHKRLFLGLALVACCIVATVFAVSHLVRTSNFDEQGFYWTRSTWCTALPQITVPSGTTAPRGTTTIPSRMT
jgi:hypothetical protein